MRAAVGVPMTMGVNEPGAAQQCFITKNRFRLPLSDDATTLHDHTKIGHVLDNIQIMSSHHQSFRTAAPIDQRLDESAFAFRIQ